MKKKKNSKRKQQISRVELEKTKKKDPFWFFNYDLYLQDLEVNKK